MKNKISLFGLFTALLFCTTIYAQNPVTKVFEDWNTTGGTQNTFQHSVVRSKGLGGATYNYVAGATLNGNGDYDMMVSKYNNSGVLLWTQTYNGAGNGDDVATDCQIDAVGNVYICGSYYKDATDSNNAIIIKYNNSGTQKWVYTYNGAGSQNDGFVALSAAGNSIIACGTAWVNSTNLYDMLIIRVDSSGNNVWTTTKDFYTLNDGAHNMYSSGGSLFVAGGAQSAATTYKYAVLKMVPSTGAITSSTLTGGTGFGIDQIADIQTNVTTGNIYITGSVFDVTSMYDIMTIMLDSTLNIVWSASYDAGYYLNDFGTGIKIDAHNNVIVTGSSETYTEGIDYTTIKYNSSGTQLWVANYDGGIAGDDSATAIVINDTDQIYVTGYSYNGSTNDYYTIRYDDLGTLKWGIGFNSLENGDDRASAIALDTNGNVIVTGQNRVADTVFSYTTVKYVEKNTLYPQDTIPSLNTSFEFSENRGQLLNTDTIAVPQIRYYTMNETPNGYFTDTSVSYVLARIDTSVNNHDTLSRVDMKFVGANSGLKIRATDIRSDYNSFFYPHCPAGIGRVQNYDKLVSYNVWNSVDIMYGSNMKGLKTYFICKPTGGGGSSSQVDLKYNGADSVRIDGSGELIIYTKAGTIVQTKAAAWQIDGSGNYSALSWQPSYHLIATNEIGFNGLGSYNTALPLIIAVDLGYKAPSTQSFNTNNVWSTYVKGGDPHDVGQGITNDNIGNTFVTGTTESADFPTAPGNVFQLFYHALGDAFCMKFNSANNKVWCTFIGGYADDIGTDVKLDQGGNPVLFGFTISDDFPMSTSSGMYQNTTNVAGDETYFLIQLDPAGINNLWSTYFGGSQVEADNFGCHLAIDQPNDLIYIAGSTRSDAITQGFPIQSFSGAYNQGTYAGNEDGFVASFDNTRNLTWSTFFGGNGIEDLTGIALVGEDVVICGSTTTTSTNNTCAASTGGGFPICNAGYYQSANQGGLDAFVARFNVGHTLVWSTFYGGSADDYANVILARNNKIYIAGKTSTTTGQSSGNQCSPSTTGDFPTCNPGGGATFINSNAGQDDIFVAAFDDNTNGLLWSTFYGGTGTEFVKGITADNSGNIFLGGYTINNGFNAVAVNPGNNYYYQANNANGAGVTADPFIIEFNSNLTATWATHYGGSSAPVPTPNDEQITCLSVGSNTKLYVTGVAASTNFPYRCDPASAYCYLETVATNANLQDVFVAEFDLTGGVGIDNYFVHQMNFNVFPNPASNTLTIDLGDAISEGDQFVIYNAIGQIVYSKNLSSMRGMSKFDIDVSNFSTGFYVAQLVSIDGGLASKKFLKQ